MTVARVGRLRRVARLTRLALHVLRGLAIAGLVFPRISESQRRYHIRRWSRQLLATLNVRLHVRRARARAPRARGPIMIIANHISWIDPFVIHAVMPARFVAKAEIARWPLVGWLTARAGTVFIHRARRRDTARINEHVTEVLREGAVIGVFPEGTTTDGSRVLHFHSSLLQPAVAAAAPIQPIALRYLRADGSRCAEVAYEDGRTLWDCVRRMAAQPEIHVELTLLEPLGEAGHRRALAQVARNAIVHALAMRARAGSRSEKSDDLRAASH